MVLLLGKMSYVCEKSVCSTFIGEEFFERVKAVSGNAHVSLSTGPRHTPVQRTGVHSGTHTFCSFFSSNSYCSVSGMLKLCDQTFEQ